MIIIAGYSTAYDFIERDAVVAAFIEPGRTGRKADGCMGVAISADSTDQVRINIFECWRDQQSLDAWRKIAKGPKFTPREINVKLYRTEPAEPPF